MTTRAGTSYELGQELEAGSTARNGSQQSLDSSLGGMAAEMSDIMRRFMEDRMRREEELENERR